MQTQWFQKTSLSTCVVCTGDLKKPTLNPTHSAVSPGENIQFICTNPTNPRCQENVEFYLYENKSSIKHSKTNASSATFSLTVNVSDQYSCYYTYRNDTVRVNSSRSKAIEITVGKYVFYYSFVLIYSVVSKNVITIHLFIII